MIKRVWVYDLETLDIFTATFIDKNSDEKRVFVLSKTRNDINELFTFLETEVKGLIGYNCLTFDAQILEYLYRNPNATAENIRAYARIITDNNENRRPDVPEWKLRINHLDLFKALSLSTKAKRTSLKWCEYMLDLENIEDMPSQGEGDNWEEMVLSYNLNDVIATKELYNRYKHEIDLRIAMSTSERVNLMNSTEPDMAKKLFSKHLCKAMKIKENDLRSLYTSRKVVNIKDIIFSYISFETESLQLLKKEFEKLELNETDKPEFNLKIGEIDVNYALGGIHGSVVKNIVKSDERFVIKSCDVVSYYPNLAIRNKLHPEHIPQKIFCDLYEGFFNMRREIPKSNPKNYILKILLNSAYGMSNDKYSFLKDRQFTLSICINGQLLLSMLFEKILLNIPDSKLIMCNTDGFEILLPREYEDIYNKLCKEWEETTKLELEFVNYSKMIISDVNNYIGIYEDITKEPKCKGRYEFKDIPLHKNKSHNIIAIAVFEHFVNNKSIEETIYNHRNIFDFCAGVRARKSEKSGLSHYELHYLEKGEIKKQKLSKTVRYFISKEGKYLIKCYEDNSWEHVEAPLKHKDWKVTYFNKSYQLEDFKLYNIDYSYYISKAREWINTIEIKSQYKLELF